MQNNNKSTHAFSLGRNYLKMCTLGQLMVLGVVIIHIYLLRYDQQQQHLKPEGPLEKN